MDQRPRRASGLALAVGLVAMTICVGIGLASGNRVREQGSAGIREAESRANALGYRLLRKGDTRGALQVLKLNVEAHPGSANAHDSLGEAWLAAGRRDLAIQSYRKAVELAPRKKSAVRALQKLTNGRRPPLQPVVLFHVVAGTVGVLAGAVAMCLRKGSRRHRAVGNVFVVSMLSMSATGAALAFVAPDGEVINVMMGVLTFYLVATAWWTARRRDGTTGAFDWTGLLVAVALATSLARFGAEAAGSETGTKDYFFFAAVAWMAAALDLRMILGGGVFAAQRLARHLWRMCVALFIAVSSLFLGQPQVFPDALRATGVLALPSLLVLLALLFWLARTLSGRPGEAAPRKREAVLGEASGD